MLMRGFSVSARPVFRVSHVCFAPSCVRPAADLHEMVNVAWLNAPSCSHAPDARHRDTKLELSGGGVGKAARFVRSIKAASPASARAQPHARQAGVREACPIQTFLAQRKPNPSCHPRASRPGYRPPACPRMTPDCSERVGSVEMVNSAPVASEPPAAHLSRKQDPICPRLRIRRCGASCVVHRSRTRRSPPSRSDRGRVVSVDLARCLATRKALIF